MYKTQPIKCVNNVNFFKSYITSSGTQNCIFTIKYISNTNVNQKTWKQVSKLTIKTKSLL